MKRIGFILVLLLSLQLWSQQRMSLDFYQDARFLFFGDDKRGYSAGTANVIGRFVMQGHQQRFGYMVVFPEFEIANIEGTYKRYSANVGYVYNKLFIANTEAGAAFGYGWIDRYGKTGFSFGGSCWLSYKIGKAAKVNLLAQITERKDLKMLWGENDWRFSGFIGLSFDVNNVIDIINGLW